MIVLIANSSIIIVETFMARKFWKGEENENKQIERNAC